MNWVWPTSFDQFWSSQFWSSQFWLSPAFPTWLTLVGAGFSGIIVIVTLLRAGKSATNGALAVVTLLAIGIAVAATIRSFVPDARREAAETTQSPQLLSVALPALSCIDDLAGEAVLTACEKALFGSPESAAAAVSYAASQIARLTARGDVAEANTNMPPEMQALRRAVERDRYGLMAYVLMARDHCTPSACEAFRSLGDNHQIASNMDERLYENLVTRYASSWNAPAPTQAAAGPVAALPSSVPTGKPTNAEFPTSASTPPVSIMVPEPAATPKPPAAPKAQAAATATTAPPPHPAPAPSPTPAAKKQATTKRPPAAPVPLAPAAPPPVNSEPASND
jgi:hypothetical protein